jgi:hypothetical protein
MTAPASWASRVVDRLTGFLDRVDEIAKSEPATVGVISFIGVTVLWMGFYAIPAPSTPIQLVGAAVVSFGIPLGFCALLGAIDGSDTYWIWPASVAGFGCVLSLVLMMNAIMDAGYREGMGDAAVRQLLLETAGIQWAGIAHAFGTVLVAVAVIKICDWSKWIYALTIRGNTEAAR